MTPVPITPLQDAELRLAVLDMALDRGPDADLRMILSEARAMADFILGTEDEAQAAPAQILPFKSV